MRRKRAKTPRRFNRPKPRKSWKSRLILRQSEAIYKKKSVPVLWRRHCLRMESPSEEGGKDARDREQSLPPTRVRLILLTKADNEFAFRFNNSRIPSNSTSLKWLKAAVLTPLIPAKTHLNDRKRPVKSMTITIHPGSSG